MRCVIWLGVVLEFCLLQPSVTFSGVVPLAQNSARGLRTRSLCAACMISKEFSKDSKHSGVDTTGQRVDAGRRQFVFGSSLLAAGSMVGFVQAEDASEKEEDGDEGGRPPWAVDIEVPEYAADKSWMWRDLQDGNIAKATTKLAAQDIYYPQWMYGLWQVESTTRSVDAPLGEELFGRDGALAVAQKDIGVPLKYQARFRSARGGRVIADRAFNVDSISRAAMGDSAVLECFLEDGNADRLKMTLVPSGAGGRVFDAFLYVTSRDQSVVSEQSLDCFGCSETSRQSVVAQNDPVQLNVGSQLVNIPRKASTSVKDIQVIQVFKREDENDAQPTSFSSVQRISTFMTEDEFRERLRSKKLQGPGTAQKFAGIKKLPIDVRVYDIKYTLLRRPREKPSPSSAQEPEDSDTSKSEK